MISLLYNVQLTGGNGTLVEIFNNNCTHIYALN